MGLDITAYEIATKIEPQPVKDETTGEWADGLWEKDIILAFAYKGFDQSLRGLEDECWYATAGETFAFRAGSYSGYNEFREALTRVALGVSPDTIWRSTDSYRTRPFFELIHFADNEGTIGPEACADLARDFAEQREDVLPKWNPEDDVQRWYRDKYDAWQQAFELAAGTGLVMFS
jgi:hypothetical protein